MKTEKMISAMYRESHFLSTSSVPLSSKYVGIYIPVLHTLTIIITSVDVLRF